MNRAFREFQLYFNREMEYKKNHSYRWDKIIIEYNTDSIIKQWLESSSISVEDKWAVIRRMTGCHQPVACWIYRQLTTELYHYNINPFPSKDYLIVDVNDKQILGKINFAKRHCSGALKFELHPMGTYFGMQPKEYNQLLFKVEYQYV